jgi:hypothetical protein
MLETAKPLQNVPLNKPQRPFFQRSTLHTSLVTRTGSYALHELYLAPRLKNRL